MLKPLLLLLALLPLAARAQSGCPDPRATNYNPAAVSNDGSCQYALTTAPLPPRAPLGGAVPETSGLQLTPQGLWTFNDGGNAPVLFRVDSLTGNVLQQVAVSNFGNVDWEDIAADGQFLYVGDFGNNEGDRRDLRILRVRQADLGPAAASVTAQAINFSYPDQTSFVPAHNAHNFDCEAFFFLNDSLHLFTKNWADLRTRHYTVPALPGTHVARLRGSFNVNGLITAADRNPAGTGAALLGYNNANGATFMWLLSDFGPNNPLIGNKRRIELPNALLVGQAEGLAFASAYRVFVSNELVMRSIITIPQRLYTLNTSAWLAPTRPLATRPAAAAAWRISPNPAHHRLCLERPAGPAEPLVISLLDLRGRTVLTQAAPATEAAPELDVAGLAAGLYVLRVAAPSGVAVRKVLVE